MIKLSKQKTEIEKRIIQLYAAHKRLILYQQN